MALWHLPALLLVFALGLVTCQYDTKEIEVDSSKHDEQFFNFLSRPDIDAPKWDFKVHNQSALAPGHWFVGPYGIVDQTDNDKAYVGPGIYNSLSGELVWNGGSDLNNFNVFGLRVSKFKGEDVLTFLQPEESHGVIMDSSYNIKRHVRVGIWRESDNMHDFQLVEDGTKALYLKTNHELASRAESLAIEYDGECNAQFTGFEERDVNTDEVTFSWSPYSHIALNESYWYPVTDTSGMFKTDLMCSESRGLRGLDYLHANSIEKLPDGDYLLSGRHAYALYKISHKDGSIVWRLGGKKSDFKMDEKTHFSAQHDARCLSQNATHMVISMMDNANGVFPGDYSNPNSRGLIVEVDTQAMTAREIMHFDYPGGEGGYAEGRGNVQMLPNGNAFVSWKDDCLHSEYTADGEMIAEAEFPAGLKTYRSFKFPWVGHATQKPAVYSHVVAYEIDGVGQQLRTDVYVSWNGDTQAGTWKLYRADVDGTTSELLNATARNGFETVVSYEGYVPYVSVDADNWGGVHLTRSVSDVVETIFQHDVGNGASAAAAASGTEIAPEDDGFLRTMFVFAVVAFPGGVAIGILLFYLGWKLWSRDSILSHRPKSSAFDLRGSREKADWPETDRLLHGHDGSPDNSQRPSREEYELG